MMMQILRDCGYMKISKILFVIGVELDLWQLFPIVLYCGCQNYRHILILLHYILSVWHCLCRRCTISHTHSSPSFTVMFRSCCCIIPPQWRGYMQFIMESSLLEGTRRLPPPHMPLSPAPLFFAVALPGTLLYLPPPNFHPNLDILSRFIFRDRMVHLPLMTPCRGTYTYRYWRGMVWDLGPAISFAPTGIGFGWWLAQGGTTGTVWLQGAFDTIIGLSARDGLCTNVVKTFSMFCHSFCALGNQ